MTTPPAGSTGPSLRSRALLAVTLTVGFYALALAISLGLIAAPIVLFAVSGRGNIWIALALIGAGIAILRAIVPPRDRFEPPGPELRPAEHPRLHSVLQDVAIKTGQAPADTVYLDLDMNASVLEHRGRRLMLLGLPLLATLSVDELRAVVAHEYGHYVGGDTRFAGWIWRTRHAVLRTVHDLATAESGFRRNFVRWPFQWYAQLFLRITNAISRRQEFAADRLSARVASPEAAGSALRRLEALAPVYPRYWASDVVPMLDARKRPPLADGFYDLASHSAIAPALDEIVKTDIEGNEADPYASHPTLRQRLEALGAPMVTTAPGPAERPATELLENLPALERQLLIDRFGEEVGSYEVADWSAAADIHLARIRETAERFGPAFGADLTIESAGRAVANRPAWRQALRDCLPPEDRDAPEDVMDDVALNAIFAVVVTEAVDAGASVSARPGEEITLGLGDKALEPWTVLAAIGAGDRSAEAWSSEPLVAELTAAGSQPRA